jgi:hypothetical protein
MQKGSIVSPEMDVAARTRILALLIEGCTTASVKQHILAVIRDESGLGNSKFYNTYARLKVDGLVKTRRITRMKTEAWLTGPGYLFLRRHSPDSIPAGLTAFPGESPVGPAVDPGSRPDPSQNRSRATVDKTAADVADELDLSLDEDGDEGFEDPLDDETTSGRGSNSSQNGKPSAAASDRADRSTVATVPKARPRQRRLPRDPDATTPKGALLRFVRIGGGHGNASCLARLVRRTHGIEVGTEEALAALAELEQEGFIRVNYHPDKTQPPWSWFANTVY